METHSLDVPRVILAVIGTALGLDLVQPEFIYLNATRNVGKDSWE